MSKNRSHADEIKGKDIPDDLIEEMQIFFDKNRSQ
jgi:hypothetical protein